MLVRELSAVDDDWKLTTLRGRLGLDQRGAPGQLIDAAELPGFVAELDGQRLGLVTFAARPDGIEVVTLQALTQGAGVGRSLMDRLHSVAIETHAPRLWLITTNDNIRELPSTSDGEWTSSESFATGSRCPAVSSRRFLRSVATPSPSVTRSNSSSD